MGTTTIYYRHVFKAGGMNTYANLHGLTRNFKMMPFLDFCKEYPLIDPSRRMAFTFVREPIARFISGYKEIEYRTRAGVRWPRFESLANLLDEYPVPWRDFF